MTVNGHQILNIDASKYSANSDHLSPPHSLIDPIDGNDLFDDENKTQDAVKTPVSCLFCGSKLVCKSCARSNNQSELSLK